MKYIHYGHSKFDINEFNTIKNRLEAVKPEGGLWASRCESYNNWKRWCEHNDYACDFNKSFMFTLTHNAKVLTINNCDILKGLPKIESTLVYLSWTSLDFEKLSQEYDAIEVLISHDPDLYFKLYGWDCDSILIMNPNIILEVKDN